MKIFSVKEIAPCLFAIIVDILGFGLVTPLLVAIFTSSDHNLFAIPSASLRYFLLGATLALYPLFMFFGTSFIGDLSDKIGRKKTLLFSMSGMGLSFILMSVGVMTQSLALFLMGRIFSGLVSASQSVALATISDLSTKENKAIHLSYIALIQCIGFVIGPLLGGVLSNFTLYMPFLGAAGFAFISWGWIFLSFEETVLKKSDKKIEFLRLLTVFSDAYRNRRIRTLCIAFLTMQIGVALYLPLLLIFFSTKFQYTPLYLGLFNGYLGLGFAIGLLFILPKMLKSFSIEKIVFIALFATSLTQFFSSFFSLPIPLWVLAFLFAIAIEIAFSGMFTSFSNAADAQSQGWVMGISVAVMAIAWAIGGLSTQLVPLVGTTPLIFVGSGFLGLSAFVMKKYNITYAH